MSDKSLMEDLILEIGDEYPYLVDEDIMKITNMIRVHERQLRRQAKPRRSGSSGDKTEAFTRENALWALRRLRISQDPDVRLIRQVNERIRKWFAADVVRQAQFWLQQMNIMDFLSGESLLSLPGNLLGVEWKEVQMPLSKYKAPHPNIEALLVHTKRTADRINREHWIEPRSTFLFLVTGEGFEQRKPVESALERRLDHSCGNQIVLKIDPWTSPEVVAAEYAKARNEHGYGKLRLQHQRTLAFVHFIATQFEVFNLDLSTAVWKRQLRAWRVLCRINKTESWAYGNEDPPLSKDVHRFARDVKRAFKVLDDRYDPRENSE